MQPFRVGFFQSPQFSGDSPRLSHGYSSSLFTAEEHFMEWMCHSLFNCSPTEEHMGGFQILAFK